MARSPAEEYPKRLAQFCIPGGVARQGAERVVHPISGARQVVDHQCGDSHLRFGGGHDAARCSAGNGHLSCVVRLTMGIAESGDSGIDRSHRNADCAEIRASDPANLRDRVCRAGRQRQPCPASARVGCDEEGNVDLERLGDLDAELFQTQHVRLRGTGFVGPQDHRQVSSPERITDGRSRRIDVDQLIVGE